MTQTFEVQLPAAAEGGFLELVPVFSEQMRSRGYAPASLKSATRLAQDFAAWLDQRQIGVCGVEAAIIDEYLGDRWQLRRCRRGDAFTLREFLRLVSVNGTAAAQKPTATAPRLHVRQQFEHYLMCERGLANASIRRYGDAVGRFLNHVFGDGEVHLSEITAAQVIRFVQFDAQRLQHSKRAKVMTSALRSFLQYGRYLGDIRADLHASVPTVANWWRIQLVNATDSLNISAGVLKPSVLRGLSFNCLAMALSCSCE